VSSKSDNSKCYAVALLILLSSEWGMPSFVRTKVLVAPRWCEQDTVVMTSSMLRVCISELEAATAAEVEAMKEAGSMKNSTEWAVATALHCNLLRMHGQQHENVVVTSASAATSLPTPATKFFGAFWWSAQAAVSLASLKQHVRLCLFIRLVSH
jgi:hypothetical protein